MNDSQTSNSSQTAGDTGGTIDEIAQARAADSERTAEQLEAQVAELQDRVLRAQAELENVRKRLRREMEEERRYYSMGLIHDLLSVLDNLHRAIDAAEKVENAEEASQGLLSGVRMVAEQLEQVLAKHHCTPIEAHGLPFDPNVHEAIGEHPHEELEPGTVAHVARRGFKLHDRVVRPSQVLVARRVDSEKAPQEKPEDDSK